jgi:hypothetical protein
VAFCVAAMSVAENVDVGEDQRRVVLSCSPSRPEARRSRSGLCRA